MPDNYMLSEKAKEKSKQKPFGIEQVPPIRQALENIPTKKQKSAKNKSKIIIGDTEEANPNQTFVQEQTIKLGGALRRGGKMGNTIGARKFKNRNLGPGITGNTTSPGSGILIRRHGP